MTKLTVSKCLIACLASVGAFLVPNQSNRHPLSTRCHATKFSTSGMWNRGLNFGKGDFKFYEGFDSFMSPFPQEDREEFPEVFTLPKGVYEVGLAKPLGIVFEEIEAGKGVYVQDLVESGNAASQGVIQKGDVLVGISATKIVGAKYERRLIPARNFDFDTVVGAIESNQPKWNCYNVIMMFERPAEADSKQVDEFLEFFEPPFDNPWYEFIRLFRTELC